MEFFKTTICRCAAVMALAALAVIGASYDRPARAASGVVGDVTGDGVVDVMDVNEVVNVILESALQPSDANFPIYDINSDGHIDVDDMNRIINIALGIVGPQSRTFTVNGVSFKMIAVEGGTFTMGATAEQGTSDPEYDEYPTHQVTLSSYSIGETEVTQALWVAVMGSNPSEFTGDNQRPVECVSWDDCQEFITKLNQLTGASFRLPTEAEWEYAARGGNKRQGYKYSGSNIIDDVAWYWYNIPSQSFGTSGFGTQTVATKSANELGLYDMSGNVYEWCQDWYGSSYYSNSPSTNPTGPASGSYRVLRGGGWYGNARDCRVSSRNDNTPFYRNSYNGLRLALGALE